MKSRILLAQASSSSTVVSDPFQVVGKRAQFQELRFQEAYFLTSGLGHIENTSATTCLFRFVNRPWAHSRASHDCLRELLPCLCPIDAYMSLMISPDFSTIPESGCDQFSQTAPRRAESALRLSTRAMLGKGPTHDVRPKPMSRSIFCTRLSGDGRDHREASSDLGPFPT